jgi:hypothetical protein
MFGAFSALNLESAKSSRRSTSTKELLSMHDSRQRVIAHALQGHFLNSFAFRQCAVCVEHPSCFGDALSSANCTSTIFSVSLNLMSKSFCFH